MGQYLCSLINHVVVPGLRIKASRDQYKINDLWAALRSRLAAAACETTGKVLQQRILSFQPRPTAQSEQSRNEEGTQESGRKSPYVGKQVSLGVRDCAEEIRLTEPGVEIRRLPRFSRTNGKRLHIRLIVSCFTERDTGLHLSQIRGLSAV